MAEQFTELQQPPEYRGGRAELYCQELARWALKYHLTLNTQLLAMKQTLANVAAVSQLTQAIDNPPTQAQVQAIQDKINSIIAAAAAV